MANEIDIKHIDRRTNARYVARGQLSEKDYEKYLKSLPDMAANAEPVLLEQPGGAPRIEGEEAPS